MSGKKDEECQHVCFHRVCQQITPLKQRLKPGLHVREILVKLTKTLKIYDGAKIIATDFPYAYFEMIHFLKLRSIKQLKAMSDAKIISV